MTRPLAALTLAAAICSLHAQALRPHPAPARPYPVPAVTLTFSSPQLTPLGKKGTVMLGNTTCAPDGSLFLEMADSPAKWEFTVHSLTNGTQNVSYAASPVPGYERVSLGFQYYAGDSGVVILGGAMPLDNPMAEREKPQWVNLALVYSRKGTLEYAVPIPQDIDAKSIGLYGSGDLLVIAKDPARNRLRLLVLDKDGDIINEFSLFDHDYDAGLNATKNRPLSKVQDGSDLIQIVPDGDNLLLLPQATAATVIEVNEQGVVRTTELQLPPGYLIRSLLSMNGAYWTVSTYTDAKIIPQASGKGSAVFRNGPLFQFNSLDGSLVRRIDSPERLHYNVLCAHDGEFTALTTDKGTGRLEVLTGSVPR